MNKKDFIKIVEECDNFTDLNDWEQMFIIDMYDKYVENKDWPPVPKHVKKIQEIYEKYR